MHEHSSRLNLHSLRTSACAALVGLLAIGGTACTIDDFHVEIEDPSDPHATCGDGHETDGDDHGGSHSTGQVEDSEGAPTGTEGDSTSEDPPLTLCGNGLLDAGEACDDGVNDGEYGGCAPGCSALGPRCGDGEMNDKAEECDDANEDNNDGCTVTCRTPACGDGVMQATEECEGGQELAESCESLGYTGGVLGCRAATCSYEFAACHSCGNAVIDGDDVCDGLDLAGATCESLGLVGGVLACDATCSGFDTSGCVQAQEPTGCCATGDLGTCTMITVEACVCDLAPECCEMGWTELCVGLAIKSCFAQCG